MLAKKQKMLAKEQEMVAKGGKMVAKEQEMAVKAKILVPRARLMADLNSSSKSVIEPLRLLVLLGLGGMTRGSPG